MFARGLAKERATGGDLFVCVGELLRAQGLGPEPANYEFAYRLLARQDEAARRSVARLTVDGIRLTREEITAMGGNVVAGPGLADAGTEAGAIADDRPDEQDAAADRLVAQTRAQVEAVASMMRAMHDETVGFGRDLAQSAAAFDVDGAPLSPGEVVRLTRAMIVRVTDAEAKLDRAAEETDLLRAELAEAQVTARRDPLTGLPNRRAFDEAFAAGTGPAGRCLAVCDIDRFKRINDAFGHAVGDRVLSAVARILADACDGHLVTRQGGEEFAVLIADGDIGAALRMLDAARDTVGARRFRARDTDRSIGQVTFSAGIVTVGADETAEAALARADRLLYRAKADGRDQVLAD